MRLLHRGAEGRYQLKKFSDGNVPRYAILSHTWGRDEDEVTFEDLGADQGKQKVGYQKIKFCEEQATKDNLDYFWIDTCCIKKTSDAELSESINSMFRWYQRATKCYVYLTDVSTLDSTTDLSQWKAAFQKSRWHTRCWTVQELLASASVEFFSREGQRLGDKKSLESLIHCATGIPCTALQGYPLSEFPADVRMSWAEKREATKVEDKAYCLLGIFGIFMPLIYGEREHATTRLRKEIKRLTQGQDKLAHHQRLLRVTDPCVDKERIEAEKGGLLKESYRWILQNLDFQQWKTSTETPLLWIRGDPGKGKTMLLCGIIDELQKQQAGNVIYFFFQATVSRIDNAMAAVRSIMYLLLEQQPSLVSYVASKYDQAGDALFEDGNAWFALLGILKQMLQDPFLKSTHLIIDALDECTTGLDLLLDAIVQLSPVSSKVKWIVSSRNWPNIEMSLETADNHLGLRLELNELSVSAAVTAYIEFKVDQLAKNGWDNATKDAVQQHLASNAQGTFLYVALVCNALNKTRAHQVKRKLKAFPPGLDKLYERMMDQICIYEDKDDAKLCKSILALVSLVFRPLTMPELVNFMALPGNTSDNYDHLLDLIALCGSFINIRNNAISFVHQSAKDFLLEKASNDIFPSGIEDLHYTVFSRSLQVMNRTLQRDIYKLGAPGFPIEQVKRPIRIHSLPLGTRVCTGLTTCTIAAPARMRKEIFKAVSS